MKVLERNICVSNSEMKEKEKPDHEVNKHTNNTNTRYVPASTQPIASQQMVHAPALPAGLGSSAKNHVGRGGEMMMIVLMMMLVWMKIKMMLCFSGMGRIVGTSAAARTEPSVTQLQAR